MVDAMGFDECAISWWDRPGERLQTFGYWPRPPRRSSRSRSSAGRLPGDAPAPRAPGRLDHPVADPAADQAEVAYLRTEDEAARRCSRSSPRIGRSGSSSSSSRTDKVLDESALELARTMANEAAMALENARHYQDARKLADHDQLTGFFNHRYLHERLGEEIVRAQRSKAPLGLLMIDLDDFKLVNDTFGHLFGDRVLAWTAEQIRSTLRGQRRRRPATAATSSRSSCPTPTREAAAHAADRIVAALHEPRLPERGARRDPGRRVDRGGRLPGRRADRPRAHRHCRCRDVPGQAGGRRAGPVPATSLRRP